MAEVHESCVEWPRSTGVCCWYCTHPFDTAPICLPSRYDDKMKVFYVFGVFCTWGCAKRFNIERETHTASISATLLTLLRHRLIGQGAAMDPVRYSIKCAPNRNTLVRFGGSMAIEEFRDGLQSLTFEQAVGGVAVANGNASGSGCSDECVNEGSEVTGMWDRTIDAVPMRFVKRTRKLERGEEHKADGDDTGMGGIKANVARAPTEQQQRRRAAVVLDSIVNAPPVKNQGYKLKRSKPLGPIGNTLFQSMNLRIESDDAEHQ